MTRSATTCSCSPAREPDSAWHRFLDNLLEVAAQLGVVKVAGLAHIRSPRRTRGCRACRSRRSAEVAAGLPFLKNSVDVPAGISAAIETRFTKYGIPSFGLWAQVYHYVAAAAYPAATVALLSGLNETVGVVTEAVAVRQEAIASGCSSTGSCPATPTT